MQNIILNKRKHTRPPSTKINYWRYRNQHLLCL